MNPYYPPDPHYHASDQTYNFPGRPEPVERPPSPNWDPSDPATFHNLEWPLGAWTTDGRTVYSLVHTEFHGGRDANVDFKPDSCSVPYDNVPGTVPYEQEAARCWYAAATLMKSTDGGATFQDVQAPPNHLVATIPYKYVTNGGRQGFPGPTHIVKRTENDVDYYYSMYQQQFGTSFCTNATDDDADGRVNDGCPAVGVAETLCEDASDNDGDGRVNDGCPAIGTVESPPHLSLPDATCLMRTTDLANPSSWQAWGDGDGDGDKDFEVAYVDPYLNNVSNPENHRCTSVFPVGPGGASFLPRSLTYNTYLKKWVVIGTGTVPGFAYALSDDLVHWGQPRTLIKSPPQPTTCADPSGFTYPSIIDSDDPAASPTSPERNFYRSDRTADVYFVSFDSRANPEGDPYCAGLDPNAVKHSFNRDVVRIPMEFARGRIADFGQSIATPSAPYGFDEIEQVGGTFTHESGGAPSTTGGIPWEGRAHCDPWNTLCSASAAYDVLWPDGEDAQYSGWFYVPADFFTGGASPSFFLTRWDNFRMSTLDSGYDDYGGILVSKADGQVDGQPQLSYKAQLVRGELSSSLQGLGDKYGVKDSFTIPANRWFHVWVWQFQSDNNNPGRPATYVYFSDGVTSKWVIFGLQSPNTHGRFIDRIRYGLIGASGNPMRFTAGSAQHREVSVDLTHSWAP